MWRAIINVLYICLGYFADVLLAVSIGLIAAVLLFNYL